MPDPAGQTPFDARGGAGSAPTGGGPPAAGRRGLLRAAGTVGGMTVLSRISGFVRDATVAALLGTGTGADAWRAAFLVPNTLRRLVGEGNISAAFIPVFTRETRRREDSEAWVLAERFGTLMLAVALALTIAGALLAPWYVPLIWQGFAGVEGKLGLTVSLTRAVFPYLLFITGAAVLMAVLNARDRFAAAAFTPVVLNIVLIVAALLALVLDLPIPTYALVVGALVGGLLQWLFLVPFARGLGMRMRPRWSFRDPALGQIGRLMVPGLFGVGIIQVNILVGSFLAAQLPEGSVSSLYYAARLNEVTIGVFAISLATVVLPTMSRQGAAGDTEGLKETLGFALRQVTTITVPATLGLVMLRQPITAVLYERGSFDSASTSLTAAALWGYALGLAAIAVVRIVAPCFYALEDTRTPVLIAAVAMIVNIIGCILLRGPLQNAGIALANSVAAFVNALLLLAVLRARLGRVGGRALLAAATRSGIAAAAMGGSIAVVAGFVLREPSGSWTGAAALTATILVGVATYILALAALRSPELVELSETFRGEVPATLHAGVEPGSGPDGGSRADNGEGEG